MKLNEMIGVFKDGKFIKKAKNALELNDLIAIEENIYDLIATGEKSIKGYTFDIVEAE